MDHEMGVYLWCAKPADGPGVGGAGDGRPPQRLNVELPTGMAQPAREVARLEDVLTPRDADPELAACLQADAAGEPQGATNLGVLLEERGDVQGALAAYRRADRRGDAVGAFNLGCLLAELGEEQDAVAAFRRADERGDSAAASNLGVLLEGQNDIDGALAAYRRGDERGDGTAAFNLGLLLAARGEHAGARAAYRRAVERGDSELRERAAQAAAELAPPVRLVEAEAEAELAAPVRLVEAEAEAEAEVPAVEVPQAEDAGPSRRRWILALCVLALLALVVGRSLRRRR